MALLARVGENSLHELNNKALNQRLLPNMSFYTSLAHNHKARQTDAAFLNLMKSIERRPKVGLVDPDIDVKTVLTDSNQFFILSEKCDLKVIY